MNVYLTEHNDNPYPIEEETEVMTFEHWIASKSEKQRMKRVNQRINMIITSILEDKIWKEDWEDNVDIDNTESPILCKECIKQTYKQIVEILEDYEE